MNILRRHGTALALLAMGIVFALLSALSARSLSRQELNYALSEAVSRRDVPRIESLLKRGADPGAPWSGYGWRDSLDRVTHRTTIFDNDTILDRAEDDPVLHRLLLRRGR